MPAECQEHRQDAQQDGRGIKEDADLRGLAGGNDIGRQIFEHLPEIIVSGPAVRHLQERPQPEALDRLIQAPG